MSTKTVNLTGSIIKIVVTLVVIGLFVLWISLAKGCTKPEETQKFLEAQGYTEITIKGYEWGMGGKADFWITGFTAMNANGKWVNGAVSQNLWGSKTLRFK